MAAHSSKLPVLAAVGGNCAIAVTKFVAAAISGSSAMLAEAIHSVLDTLNQLLLLYGLRHSRKPPDALFPFGYGREVYFWSLIVAVLLFSAGGGMALYEGIVQLIHPRPLQSAFWAYLVLGIAAVCESVPLALSWRALGRRGRGGLLQRLHDSKDPSVFVVFFEDAAALLGLVVAFLGIYLGHKLGNPHYDGAASILIGVILCGVALALVYESRGLLIGESADPAVTETIASIAARDPAVAAVRTPLTMHLGPDEILLNLEVEFRTHSPADEQMRAVMRIEEAIRSAHPAVKRIFIEARPRHESLAH
ncbi:MAG: cation diffusion facilitator family transporter [Proteobacteria bacterium]|nr:cation diffusion facilitator family transporter [Pseudomonadota bacterium]